MDRKIFLAILGFLIFLLAAGLADYSYAETNSTASADDAVATAQTSQNPLVVPEGVTTNVPVAEAGVGQSTNTQYRTPMIYMPDRRCYVVKAPVAVVAVCPRAVRVTNYRRLYATPIRDTLFGKYRAVATPVWYPLQQ